MRVDAPKNPNQCFIAYAQLVLRLCYTVGMFTEEQLHAIQSAMEEEHRKDRDALQRVMRYAKIAGVAVDDGNVAALEKVHSRMTVIDGIKAIMRDGLISAWTAQSLVSELKKRGIKLSSSNPVQSVSATLKKLHDRNVVTLKIRGSGRQPNSYQWAGIKTTSVTKGEAEEDAVTE